MKLLSELGRNSSACAVAGFMGVGVIASAPSGCSSEHPVVTLEDLGTVQQEISTKKVGVHATKSYENGWLVSLDMQWNMSGNFVSKMDDYDQVPFYYNLVGKQYYWHETGDHASNSLESVDLFFSVSHGGYDGFLPTRDAVFGMYDDNVLARSSQMRLGNDGSEQLSIFSFYGCSTMYLDSYTGTRWYPIFAGGLRFASGFHDAAGGGTVEGPVGTTYATYLQSTSTLLGDAWGWATTSVSSGNPAMVMTTANNSTNCWSRLSGMKWSNFGNYSRYRDNDIGYTCWVYWN